MVRRSTDQRTGRTGRVFRVTKRERNADSAKKEKKNRTANGGPRDDDLLYRYDATDRLSRLR
ncbi:hypothetical protein ZHAS_00018528 [Anopheles sinensis]|uniref:Uncharacterized protein n=1 Tax=Anopheles sinensis TaxID=74873 RepID=A0A084WJU7_ANOSI|nr:hypothetical protein ZHAS_00018528 [Anopheles sinensis]